MARRNPLYCLTVLTALGAVCLHCNRSAAKKITNEPFPVMATKLLLQGSFRPLAQKTAGEATVYELADGGHVIRFTSFETSEAPDLHVYLTSTQDSGASTGLTSGRTLDLGRLKHASGSQNYELPRSAALNTFRSAIIRSESQGTNFAVASLAPPSLPPGHGFQLEP